MSSVTQQFLVSCEHGGNRIPLPYRQFFLGHEELLKTHRGYDAGALPFAKGLAKALGAPLYFSTTSRLLIDLNRSVGHPHLYSKATRAAPDATRREILSRYYLSYRNRIEAEITQAVANGDQLVHISCHSFTPELDGEIRNADIGLLYDPTRTSEVDLCGRWRATLKTLAPQLKVRRNYPYTGKSDGFTAYLRRRFAADQYIGIELEINQSHVFKGGRQWQAMRQSVVQSLCTTVRWWIDPRANEPRGH
jgi:predicted N-formylglutamate amidohydrolase